MTAAAGTLGRLRALERLYAHGYADEVVDLTVRKLLEHQIQKDEAQLAELREDLARFEGRYAMTSADFFRAIKPGRWVTTRMFSSGTRFARCSLASPMQ